MGRRPGPGVNEADVPSNLPTLTRARTLAPSGRGGGQFHVSSLNGLANAEGMGLREETGN